MYVYTCMETHMYIKAYKLTQLAISNDDILPYLPSLACIQLQFHIYVINPYILTLQARVYLQYTHTLTHIYVYTYIFQSTHIKPHISSHQTIEGDNIEIHFH